MQFSTIKCSRLSQALFSSTVPIIFKKKIHYAQSIPIDSLCHKKLQYLNMYRRGLQSENYGNGAELAWFVILQLNLVATYVFNDGIIYHKLSI